MTQIELPPSINEVTSSFLIPEEINGDMRWTIDGEPVAHPQLGWALEPGDLVCFHMLALHASAGVDGDRRRRVFSVRFLGDDMRHAPRTWKTSPEFPGLADELPAGAEMDHPRFPLLVGGNRDAP